MKKLTSLVLFAGIIAVLCRNFLVYYVGAITPGYSAGTNFISELSAEGSPYALEMNIGSLILLGSFLILTAKALHNRLQGPGADLSMGYLAIAGVAFICIGSYPCPPGCLGDINSMQMTIHMISAFVATLSMSLGALLFGLWYFKGFKSPLRAVSLVLGSVGILAFVGLWVTIVGWQVGIDTGLMPVKGLMQRLNVAAGDLWVALVCVYCLRPTPVSITNSEAEMKSSSRSVVSSN